MNKLHSSGGGNSAVLVGDFHFHRNRSTDFGHYWRDVVVFVNLTSYAEITMHDDKIRDIELSLVNSRIMSLDRLLP